MLDPHPRKKPGPDPPCPQQLSLPASPHRGTVHSPMPSSPGSQSCIPCLQPGPGWGAEAQPGWGLKTGRGMPVPSLPGGIGESLLGPGVARGAELSPVPPRWAGRGAARGPGVSAGAAGRAGFRAVAHQALVGLEAGQGLAAGQGGQGAAEPQHGGRGVLPCGQNGALQGARPRVPALPPRGDRDHLPGGNLGVPALLGQHPNHEEGVQTPGCTWGDVLSPGGTLCWAGEVGSYPRAPRAPLRACPRPGAGSRS